MTIEETQQPIAALEGIVKALEKQSTDFNVWTIYQKEQNEQVRQHERKMARIQQENVDLYKKQVEGQEQQRAEELERLRSAHAAILDFVVVRNIKIVEAIDQLCERTALPKPNWFDLEPKTRKEE